MSRGGAASPSLGSAWLRHARPLAVVAVTAAIVSGSTAGTAMALPPNVVLIVTDDQRYGTLRWMPAVQELLVQRGATYTRAFAPTPTCCPSRASLLTGLLAQGTGVWANGGSADGVPIGGWRAFRAAGMERRTIATWFTRTHRTILVGKYLNNYDEASGRHIPRGWDRWHSFDEPNGSYYNYRLIHTDGSRTYHGWGQVDYSTDVFARLAVAEIRATPRRRPLLLFFTPTGPHGPTTPAPRHAGLGGRLGRYASPSLNERHLADKPPWIGALSPVNTESLRIARRHVYASLRSIDEATARIVKTLKREGRLHRTLFVFTSDNGVSWGEHRIPINDKFVPYAAQTHVPLVLRWDRHIRAGSRVGRLAINADVPVTAADAARIEVADEVAGLSLIGRERRRRIPFSASVGSPHSGNGISFARPAYCGLRTRRFLYVRYASGDEELYDYRHDPHELKNRAGTPRFRDLRRTLRDRTQEDCAPTPPGFRW